MKSTRIAAVWLMAFMVAVLIGCGGDPTPSVVLLVSQPANQSAVRGSVATFSISDSGASYQWQRDSGSGFADIPGANAASYTTEALTADDDGDQYRVVVSGGANSITSSAATLTVTTGANGPAIVLQPASVNAVVGQTATFVITATGTSLVYAWERSTDAGATYNIVDGVTSATLTQAGLALTDDGTRYRVVVSNTLGSVTSSVAMLNVTTEPLAPVFVTQPANVAVTAGQSAVFTAAATSSPNPTYQWQISTNGGTTFTDITAATAASYTKTATVVGDDGAQLRVTARNITSSATSNAATLSVSAAPVAPTFVAAPASITVISGQAATFSVSVGGVPTPTLQWQLSTDAGASFANIQGATLTSYTTALTTLADDAKRFRVVASNSSGITNSTAARLTVTPPPAAVLLVNPVDQLANVSSCSLPAMAVDASGRLFVARVEGSGSTFDAYVSRRGLDGVWQSLGVVNDNTATTLKTTLCPTIAVTTDGTPYVAFMAFDGRSSGSTLRRTVRRHTGGTTWETLLNTVTTNTFDDVKVIMDNLNRPLIVWNDGQNAMNADRYSGSAWGRLATNFGAVSGVGNGVYAFRVAMRPDNTLAVAAVAGLQISSAAIHALDVSEAGVVSALGGVIASRVGGAEAMSLYDIAVTATETVVSYRSGPYSTNLARAVRFDGGAWVQLGAEIDQLSANQAVLAYQGGTLVQVGSRGSLAAQARRWNGASWNALTSLTPVLSNAANLVVHDGTLDMVYFNYTSGGGSGAGVARLIVP